ncbi:SAM-dependent methyltransferase [Asanoa sp. WMMD1127]|uniref:SAM-dependent methyltransferase n=1 Tax=Asanoa sp. WMMD1127 TaxID=3016107 RepID=UPI002416148B|nr:SAM-dependent methyltransferase [Asanoa sp. WMMD1127]MDG4824670.1 SAM-dependent methyltransferase [Asanoa sp. WMMD1127]
MDQVPEVDTSVPHSARIWNYWLGGKDNFAADRAAGDRVREVFPAIVDNARAQRAFLGRAVRHLTAERGVRQFLDLGTGLPTADNTHEIAQSVAPESRVVYVDNDPLVLVHARALLASSPEGVTDYVDADVRDPETILREAGKVLDLDRPVAVVMLGILGNIPDYDEACAVVRAFVDAIPSGSYLVVNDGTAASAEIAAGAQVSSQGGHAYALRTTDEFARYFTGLDLEEPGLVPTTRWRPTGETDAPTLDGFCGVARKP